MNPKTLVASLAGGLLFATPLQAQDYVDEQSLAAAAAFTSAALSDKVKNDIISPHWLIDGETFWYLREGTAGPEWVLVSIASKKRTRLFDDKSLRPAAEAAAGGALPPVLPVTSIARDGKSWKVTLNASGSLITCHVRANRCASVPLDDAAVWSPDGVTGIVSRNDNLWRIDRGSGQPRQLTSDGVPFFGYGARPGTSYQSLPAAKQAAGPRPVGIYWSPQGGAIVATRVDERAIKPYPFIEYLPEDGGYRPEVQEIRLPLPGDENIGSMEAQVLDVATGRSSKIKLPQGWQFSLLETSVESMPAISWSKDGAHVYGLAGTRARRSVGLFEIETATGKTRLVVEEQETGRPVKLNVQDIRPSNLRVLTDSSELIWFSEKSGRGQLYLYDLKTGVEKRQLTFGEESVWNLVDVDQGRRQIYYTKAGGDGAEDAYQQKLYRVSLDGGKERLLSFEALDHDIPVGPVGNGLGAGVSSGLSPNGKWVIDRMSSLDTPTRTVVRSAENGEIVYTAEIADASALREAGWRVPKRFKLTAAEGSDPVWATVYFPPDMKPGQRYPLIDAIYGGPFISVAPTSFNGSYNLFSNAASVAQLGYIVAIIDGRGTAGRSRAFSRYGYGEHFSDAQLADHVAGIKQLAEMTQAIDLTRVGIYGHSFGGYFAARAMLDYPDFYKVGVSSAGPTDYLGVGLSAEIYFGVPDFGSGSPVRTTAAAVPINYKALDLAPLASRLKGRLLIGYGDQDENVYPTSTLKLAESLQRAGKLFELAYVPRASHYFHEDPYFLRRSWTYFLEHLRPGALAN